MITGLPVNALPGISKNLSETILLLCEQGTYITFMLCVQTVLVCSHVQSPTKSLGKNLCQDIWRHFSRKYRWAKHCAPSLCLWSLTLIPWEGKCRGWRGTTGHFDSPSTSRDACGTVAMQHAHRATCLQLWQLPASLGLQWLWIGCSLLTTDTLQNISDSYI